MEDKSLEITNISDRELLESFVKLDTEEALGMDKKAVRSAISNLAVSISEDGKEESRKGVNGEVNFRWVKDSSKQGNIPTCIFMEGRVNGKFTSISMPLVDWGEGVPMSAVSFSLISSDVPPVHIKNSSDFETNMDSMEVKYAVIGIKWIVKNLLNWKSGSPQIPSTTS